MGLSTAWYLRRGGADPVVVEAGSAGGGCSRGNAGWVCPSISSPLPAPGLTLTSLARMLAPGSPLYIRPAALPQLRRWLARFRSHCTNADYAHGIRALAALNAKTMDRFQQFSEDGVQFEYHRTALLCAFREPKKAEAMRAEVEAIAAESNTSYHAVSESELYDQEPMLRPGFCSGLLIESNLHVRPETLTGGLARALSSRGVVVREGVSVTGFKTEGRQVRALLTTTGAIDVDAVVIAAGAHSGRLARAAGTPIPLTAGKGYSVTVERPRNQLRQPLYLGEAKVGLTPFRNALRFSGTMELSGLNQRLDPKRVRAPATGRGPVGGYPRGQGRRQCLGRYEADGAGYAPGYREAADTQERVHQHWTPDAGGHLGSRYGGGVSPAHLGRAARDRSVTVFADAVLTHRPPGSPRFARWQDLR